MKLSKMSKDSEFLRDLGADEWLIQDCKINPLYFQRYVITESDGLIVGASLARVTSEMTLLFAPDVSYIKRQKAINMLLKDQVIEAKRLGINQVHVWTDISGSLME